MDNIIAMITLTKKTPDVIQAELAERVRARRRELRYSQAELAERSGVDTLFARRRYGSIEEVIADVEHTA